MGSEAVCRVSYKDEASEGKALLETAELIFRGDFRLKIPFSQVVSLEAADGELRVGYDGGVAVLELGRNAEKWAEKIRNPRGLLDKLGVKPGMTVSVLGVEDDGFVAQLRGRVGELNRELVADADLVFYEADVSKTWRGWRSCGRRSSRRAPSGWSRRRARPRCSRTPR